MIFVDTTYFLAIVDRRDSLHERSRAWADAVGTELKLTTEYVLVEVVNALSLHSDRPRATALLSRLFVAADFRIEWASRATFESVIDLFRSRVDKNWSLTDCISIQLMRQLGVSQALTYDHHFEQASLEALLRRDPS